MVLNYRFYGNSGWLLERVTVTPLHSVAADADEPPELAWEEPTVFAGNARIYNVGKS